MFRNAVHARNRNVLHMENSFKHFKYLMNLRKYSNDVQNAGATCKPDISQDMITRIEKRHVVEKKEKSKTNTSFVFLNREAPTINSFSPSNFKQWWKYIQHKALQQDQCFIRERHETLGYDLAAAHFILSRGGQVMFKDFPEWIDQNDENYSKIPNTYNPNFIVTGIDICGFNLCYEGLDNLLGLTHVEWLSLKGSLLDDWGLDKISAEFPNLKYLDASDCKNLSERGLESLYRMTNLEKLIVTNHHKSAAFELTCMMLEDCNPKLTCEILVPEEKN